MRATSASMTKQTEGKDHEKLVDAWRTEQVQAWDSLDPFFRDCNDKVWVSASQAHWACDLVYGAIDDYLTGVFDGLNVFRSIEIARPTLLADRISDTDDTNSPFYEQAKLLTREMEKAFTWALAIEGRMVTYYHKHKSDIPLKERQQLWESKIKHCMKFEDVDYERDRIYFRGSNSMPPTQELR